MKDTRKREGLLSEGHRFAVGNGFLDWSGTVNVMDGLCGPSRRP